MFCLYPTDSRLAATRRATSRFDDIDPGSYILSAQRNGYLIATYGKADGAADRIDVGSGQSVTGIAVKMTPQAVITGKILDEDGDPVLGARVTVARWSYQNGKRQLLNRGGGSSDFEGVYSVANLQAGSYILMVVPQPNLLGNVQQKGVVETVPPTYYPGVTDPAAATAIQVAAGAIRIRGTIAGDSSVGRVVSLMPEGGFDSLPLGVNQSGNVRRGGLFGRRRAD